VNWSCTIPDLPPSNNVYLRLHWAKQQRVKQDWERWIWALVNQSKNRCPRPLGRVEIRAVCFFPLHRRRDRDNFTATLAKFVQDGLVKAGIIPDDDASRCVFHPVQIMSGDEAETVLTIEEVSA